MAHLVQSAPLLPDCALFYVGKKTLCYCGNLMKQDDGSRWLHIGPLNEVKPRVSLDQAVFVAENVSPLFMKGLIADLAVDGDGELSTATVRPDNRDD